jgi:nucleoside-triphosphate--adenylate kinase
MKPKISWKKIRNSGLVKNMWWICYKVPGKDDETGEDLIQREDDKPESVLKRLEIFSSTTKPVLEFYSSMGICKDFKGTESKKIWPHVEAYLKTLIHW